MMLACLISCPHDWDTGGGYGNWLSIDHGSVKGKNVSTHYAHLSTNFLVNSGDLVKKGQIIAYSGHNGYSTQPHIHLTTVVGSVYVDPYNESSASVDQYTNSEDNYLWTTNPPSHGFYNATYFEFNNGSADGMTPNWSMVSAPLGGAESKWRVQVNGADPGVDSPIYPAGLMTKNIVIEFSVKVLSGSNPVNEGRVYLKDETGSWDNSVALHLINSEVGHNNGLFEVNGYNVYRAVLPELTRSSAQMRQFSIQLTNGHESTETWTFDWIKVKVSGWDFKDNPIGWEIRQSGVTADYYANEFWRINPTGKQPQIMSPDNLMVNNIYSKIGIRYSVRNNGSETVRAYFDTGSGFSALCSASNSVVHNKNSQTVVLDLPLCAIGHTKRVLFDLFDNNTFQNKLIAVNNISFLADDSSSTGYEVPTYSSFLTASSGGGAGDYIFGSTTLCQTVSNGTPSGRNYTFYPSDSYVGIWSEFADIYDSLNIMWKWYKPNGTLLGECNHITDWPTNVYWGNYKIWRFLDISGLTEYGQWRVELHVNGTLVDTKYFSLAENISGGGSNPPPDPAVTAPEELYILIYTE
jgi:hypothetical protein